VFNVVSEMMTFLFHCRNGCHGYAVVAAVAAVNAVRKKKKKMTKNDWCVCSVV